MAKKKILIVEDETDIAETIEYNLQQEGYQTRIVGDGGKALDAVRQFRPDLIVLDVMLPGMDGFEICKRLKADDRYSAIPILMLTVRASEVDVVLGLELGAEDYVAKPFRPRELVARIKTILRRDDELAKSEPRIQYYNLTINNEKREVLIDDKLAAFSRTEFEILALLASKPGKVFSRNFILERCWPEGVFVVDRSVDVHINSIRKKLGAMGPNVETVRGIGYKMKE